MVASKYQFQNRSLAFIRTILGRKPVAGSAFEMANRYKAQLVRSPRPGMVCFWGLREPGGCGLYLDGDLILTVDFTGRPTVIPLSEVEASFMGAMHWPTVPAPKTARDGTE